MPSSSFGIETDSPRPRYLQLADDLRRQIENGTLQAGDQVMPEVELAQQHKLARGTVRQALQLLVNQGLLERTRRKGTFVASHDAAPATPLISIIVPSLREALIHGILVGVESTLRLHGYSLIFGHTDGSLDTEIELVRRIERDRARGLILFPAALPGEAARLAQSLPARFPVVLLDRTIPGYSAGCILVDNFGGAYRAVEHLLALGHRRIACVVHARSISSVQDRVRGYQQALRDARLDPLPPAVFPGRDSGPDGQPGEYAAADLAAVDRLLDGPRPPTAFFCINDFLALAVMQHLLRRGLRLPAQVALVGFDDIPLAPFMPVPLTTVAQPKFEIGTRAAMLLLDQLAGRPSGTQTIVLPAALVVRASTVAD